MLGLLLALSSQALAFCGTYVASAGTEVYNSLSEVVVVRQGTRTTLTMASDVIGTPSNFAMVVPVPHVVREEDLHVVSAENIELLRAYSMPRLVEYTCSDFEPRYAHPCPWMEEGCGDSGLDYRSDGGSDGADGGGGGDGGHTSVEVEAEYIVGEYSVVVLSAEDSGDLLRWLDDEGYAVPEATADVLQEYIDGGSYFLAAQVREDAGLVEGDSLSPLQLAYDAEVYGLPIRLGTTASKGTQDLIIYALNSMEDGAVGIANYPERAVEDECMWDGQGDFGEFYAGQFNDAYAQEPGAIWTTEYAWEVQAGAQKCDPCTAPPPEVKQIATLGYDAPPRESIHLTRIHVRYTPEEATQDLVLYQSHQRPSSQARYIVYKSEMEDRFPTCGLGWATEPGTCTFVDPYADVECVAEAQWDAQCAGALHDAQGGCGCGDESSKSSVAWLVVGLGLLGLRRRR